MSQKSYSTSSPPPGRKAVARTSNHSQDSKFASDVSGSSPLFPDSSVSSQLMPQNRKKEEVDLTVPISYEGTLHSSKKEILEDTPIQKNNYNPINGAKFTHAGVTQAPKAQVHGSNEDVVSPKVHASVTKNGKAVNSMMVSKLNVPNTAAPEKAKPKMEKTPNKKMAQSSESETIDADIDSKVSSYISRAKLMIRTISNVGGGKSGNENDTGNGRFTDFINRSRLRLRTSSISEGKDFPKIE